MRTLTAVTWFCLEFFDFCLALSFPTSLSLSFPTSLSLSVSTSLSSRAPVRACVHVLRGGGGACREREGTCEVAVGRRWLCWGGG